MSLALATYKDRIATLFESLDRFVIIESPLYDIENLHSILISNNSINELLQVLKKNNVKVLICGAISGCIRQMIETQGIQVIPWIKGNIKNVIHAYRTENLFSSAFTMPGCIRRGRHGRPWSQKRT